MPSGANSAPREKGGGPPPTFFLDRQIGKYVVAGALRKAGAIVEVHDDHFPQETEDVVWIPAIAARGWVLITRDQNIRYNALERAAYSSAKLRGFIVTGKGMGGAEFAELMVACLPRMTRKVSRAQGPLLYTISRGGNFARLKV
jgi:hypothetical protein